MHLYKRSVLITTILVTTLAISACKKHRNVEFESTIYSIHAGDTITLSWNVNSDGEKVLAHQIDISDIGQVDATGEMTFAQAETATYTLTDTRTLRDGSHVAVQKSITIVVDLKLADWHPKSIALENCVKTQNPTAVYANDVDSVICYDIVTSLEGVQYLANLNFMQLLSRYGGGITSLDQLKPLKALNTAIFYGFPISDIAAIEYLPNLRTFGVANGALTDISDISKLQNPWIVYLNANPIQTGWYELEKIMPQVAEGGWVDFREEIFSPPYNPIPLPRVNCENMQLFKNTTLYARAIYWPEYCS